MLARDDDYGCAGKPVCDYDEQPVLDLVPFAGSGREVTVTGIPAVANATVRLLDHSTLPPAGTSVPARLFTCVGSDDEEYRDGIERFQAELAERNYQDLRYEHVTYPGMHHIATGASGFIAGLQSVFVE